MARSVPESDWKLFRQLHPLALDRFCERVLQQLEKTVGDTKRSSHERYLAIYKLIEEQDAALSRAFDDKRRSTALFQLALIYSQDLITEEEITRFTPETRDAIALLSGRKA
jgi:hypothetical protein